MMKKKIIFFILLSIFNSLSESAVAEVFIVVKVNNEIVTNTDISNEAKYLEILNPNLKQIDNNQLLIIAKNSLINEIIKKKEIQKFLNIEKEDPKVGDYLKNLYLTLNYNSEEEFKKDLEVNNNYSFKQLKQKIKIELLWNQFIYSKYIGQIKIDKKEILKKIDLIKNESQKNFNISEIVFKKNKDKSLEEMINEIQLSISEIGFSNTATIFSLADSSKFGGKIGWINQNALAKPIYEEINRLNVGDHSEIIKINNNYLIVKVNEVKVEEVEIDQEKELQKLEQAEINKQLNQFSRIYFDKSKMNYSIDEKK
tara:strand:- start:95 stop:1030 length:936 start_codon:yes stop_codon:yes gene_type:complete